ncbi:MAG TPA: 6,7-dimethyl-8-ribityllumazine synthase [Gemmatimonadales bacterium]
MHELTGRLRPYGRVGILVSRYNELVTRRLLEGAREVCSEAGISEAQIDVVWVPGAFELPAVASCCAATGRYACLVALGAVIRGDTPHFEYVAAEAARGLNAVAVRHALPVGFGVLTVDTMEQAADRAGGNAGNKGREAAEAALLTADILHQIRGMHA